MSTTTVAGRVVHAGSDAAHAVDPDQVSDRRDEPPANSTP